MYVYVAKQKTWSLMLEKAFQICWNTFLSWFMFVCTQSAYKCVHTPITDKHTMPYIHTNMCRERREGTATRGGRKTKRGIGACSCLSLLSTHDNGAWISMSLFFAMNNEWMHDNGVTCLCPVSTNNIGYLRGVVLELVGSRVQLNNCLQGKLVRNAINIRGVTLEGMKASTVQLHTRASCEFWSWELRGFARTWYFIIRSLEWLLYAYEYNILLMCILTSWQVVLTSFYM